LPAAIMGTPDSGCWLPPEACGGSAIPLACPASEEEFHV